MIQALPKIDSHSRIELHYSISLGDGTEVVSTFAEAPIVCTIGDGTLADRLEQCLIGMSKGNEGTFMLSGDEVFGPADENNVQSLDISTFPTEMSLSVGQVVAFTTPAGDELAGIIQSLNADEVLVDFNHPLSGHIITFRVHILDVVN